MLEKGLKKYNPHANQKCKRIEKSNSKSRVS